MGQRKRRTALYQDLASTLSRSHFNAGVETARFDRGGIAVATFNNSEGAHVDEARSATTPLLSAALEQIRRLHSRLRQSPQRKVALGKKLAVIAG